MLTKWCLAAVCCLSMCTRLHADVEWHQFRGPSGQGISDAVGLPLHWDEATNVVWKTPIVGEGWSSPVYGNGHVWVTSATIVAASEEVRQEKIAGTMTGKGLDVAQTITLWAVQLDLKTGDQLRQIKLADVDEPQPIHSLNSYASPTPVLADGRLYCHFGDYGTFCLDASTGTPLWQQRINLEHAVGPGSSPFLYDDLLILTCDGLHTQFVTALNTSDGSIAWRTDRPPLRTDEPEYRKAFCTPLLINVHDEDQLVIPGAQWFIAYEPRTGKEIWRVDHGGGFSNVPRPVYDGQRVYLCTGFMTTELWAVRVDGRGDVTSSHVDWKISKQMPTMPSPVVFGERLYTINDAGIAQCFNVSDGERVWTKRVGGKYSASPLLAERRIYLCSHDGRTTVIAAGDEYQQLAENQLDGRLMASPVVVDDDLLLRTDTHLYRIGE